MPSPERMLVVKPDAIGDFVLFSGCFSHLKRSRRNRRITVLVQETVAELAATCPGIDEVLTFDRERLLSDRSYSRRILRDVRQRRFGVAVYAAFSREVLGDYLALESGAAETVAFSGDDCNMEPEIRRLNDRRYTRLVTVPRRTVSELDRNAALVSALCGRRITRADIRPELNPSQSGIREAFQLLREHGIARTFLALNPFSKDRAKHWPLEKWAGLVESMENVDLVICGGKKDREAAAYLLHLIRPARTRKVVSLCGQLSLDAFAALLSRAALNVSVDSAALHMATAVSTPSVVLMGGAQPARFAPYSDLQHLVRRKMPCDGCDYRCRFATPHCLDEIEVEEVRRILVTALPRLKAKSGRADRFNEWYLFGSLLEGIGEDERAAACFRSALACCGSDTVRAGCHYHLGVLACRRGNQSAAQRFFEQCLELEPGHEQAGKTMKKCRLVSLSGSGGSRGRMARREKRKA